MEPPEVVDATLHNASTYYRWLQANDPERYERWLDSEETQDPAQQGLQHLS